MNRLNNQIESKNMNNEYILKELDKLKEEALLIEDEYSNTARKYGMSVEKLESKLDLDVNRVRIGSTIGVHIGPNAFGVCFVSKL